MGKILKLYNEKYENNLREIIEFLKPLADQVEEFAVNLAVVSKWDEWSQQQKEGAVVDFSEAMHDSGDARVDALLELSEKISETLNKIKRHE